jgi:hypothetical protein
MYPFEINHFKSSSQALAILAQTLLLAFVLIFTAAPLYAEDQERIDSMRKSVSALASARQTALQELENTTMPASEVADYKDFVVYLNTRIANYCMELAEQGGAIAIEELPCPTLPTMVGGGAPPSADDNLFYTTGTGVGETETQAEKTAQLEGDFLASLGEFDESLLKEEEKVSARVPKQREPGISSGSGMTGGSGSSYETGEEGSGAGKSRGERGEGESSDLDGEGQTGDSSSSRSGAGAGEGNIDHSIYGAPGGKLPPPEDDDIVARQLREAAEKEPDPELKKKLWEEYWKYKGVTKKGG